MINRSDGRQYDDVAASKAGKTLRDFIVDAHRSIYTYEPSEDGFSVIDYTKGLTNQATELLLEYLSQPFTADRRSGSIERRALTAEELATRLADKVAEETSGS